VLVVDVREIMLVPHSCQAIWGLTPAKVVDPRYPRPVMFTSQDLSPRLKNWQEEKSCGFVQINQIQVNFLTGEGFWEMVLITK
jgi:hypothetical protein